MGGSVDTVSNAVSGMWDYAKNNPDTMLRLASSAAPLTGAPALSGPLSVLGAASEIYKYPSRQQAYQKGQVNKINATQTASDASGPTTAGPDGAPTPADILKAPS